MKKRKYGLLTSITMITGIVIGSGIFFKADNVLGYTNGNVLLGILVFFVAALAIVFGSLTISQLATRTDKAGGLITYAEEFVSIGLSNALGWFETFLYMPALAAVVSWVSGIYLSQLFGLEITLERSTVIGIICMTVLFVLNALSAKLGGYFQNASMFIKLIPLLLIAILGLFTGNPGKVVSGDALSLGHAMSSGGWISAFAPIAFSFDGWIIATSICHEIKNSKKNLPLALAISPMVILLAYLIYFVGISSLVGPDVIVKQGDESAFTAAVMLFGPFGAKIILLFLVISVLGTVNGIVLGFIRLPYSLAIRNMLPGSRWMKRENEKLGGMPLNSAILAYLLSMFWMAVHYITQKCAMPGDVSEIAIGVSYLIYIFLYVAVMKLAKRGEIRGKIKGYVIPSLAIIGSVIIIMGSIKNPLFPYYMAVCGIIIAAGWLYYRRNKDRIL